MSLRYQYASIPEKWSVFLLRNLTHIQASQQIEVFLKMKSMRLPPRSRSAADVANRPDVLPPPVPPIERVPNWLYPLVSSPESAPKFVVTWTISLTLWQITFSSKLGSFVRFPQFSSLVPAAREIDLTILKQDPQSPLPSLIMSRVRGQNPHCPLSNYDPHKCRKSCMTLKCPRIFASQIMTSSSIDVISGAGRVRFNRVRHGICACSCPG